MSFLQQNSLSGTVQQLKEIVSNRDDGHELVSMVQQMEALIAEIEHKSARANNMVGTAVTPAVVV
jgi:hypothetical protein